MALGTLEPLEDSPLISLLVSPEEIGRLHGGDELSLRRTEMKVRKNEMKVRKNEMKLRKKDFEVPKNFSIPPWRFGDLHRGIERFP